LSKCKTGKGRDDYFKQKDSSHCGYSEM